MNTRFLWEVQKEEDNLADIDVDGMIMLKWITGNRMGICIGLIWFRIRSSNGLF
jgi:hypothetical protein